MDVEVRMKFGQRVQGSEGPNITRKIQLKSDGSNSILEIKEKVAVGLRPGLATEFRKSRRPGPNFSLRHQQHKSNQSAYLPKSD
jgi:hypothetical protein